MLYFIEKILNIIVGLVGLNSVIIVHEIGHLLAAKIAGIPAPLFSIGFGFPLFAITLGNTIYQFAAFPIGGYVSLSQAALDAQPYLIKVFVIVAGIGMNFFFAFFIFFCLRVRAYDITTMTMITVQSFQNRIIGPIGIIGMLNRSIRLGISYYFLALALLSISVGFFNLLPIPFFDGGQLTWYTIETIIGPLPDVAFSIISYIFIVFFLVFLVYISAKDIRSYKK